MREREILRRAILSARAAEFAAARPDESWIPSAEYQRKIGKLTRKTENPFWKYVNTAGKKAAAILFAVIIALSAMMSVKAIRESVVRFILSVFEKGTEISVDLKHNPDAPEKIERRFAPAYLPKGYTMEETIDTEWDREIDYRGENDAYLLFYQKTLSVAMNVDTEGVELHEITVGGNEGYWFVNHGVTRLIWSDGNYLYDLYAAEAFPIEELLKIAESVAPEKNG